jgi:transcriptional regulator with GAF, ATPase, and Fis domain
MQIRRCRLVVVKGPDTGLTAEVESSVIRVGARKGCDIVLNDRRVSGHHFEIQLDQRGYRIRDLDSTNGTYLGGHRIYDAYLNPGSIIYAGDTRLRFEPLEASRKVQLSSRQRLAGMVGCSVATRAFFAKVEKAAPTESSVLITGETGCGKELVAEAIHELSPRKNGPFVVLDCGSLPENLVESELFGHERGAFTGAINSYAGAFERANGGTVFLDEIGELPISLQPKLLGVLERRQVRRLGGNAPINVDVRIVAATNRDLAKEMNRGTFREDLYYRLAVLRVHVPPLRERLEDIPLLVEHFLSMLPGGDAVRLRPETIDKLRNHHYPGNVRELRNLIERSVVLAQSGGFDEEAPWAQLQTPVPVSSGGAAAAPNDPGDMSVHIDVDVPFKQAKQRMVGDFERRYLAQLMDKYDGNVSRAARAAGLDRMTVHKMLTRRGLAAKK